MLYHQLLIDLFQFLAPFLRNVELAKQTYLLYKVYVYLYRLSTFDFMFATRWQLKYYICLNVYFLYIERSQNINKTFSTIIFKTMMEFGVLLFSLREPFVYCWSCYMTSQNFCVTTTSLSVTSFLLTASRWGIWSWAPSQETCACLTRSRQTSR